VNVKSLKIGEKWTNNLDIFIPVDSISQGFIKISVVNENLLESVKENIANIKISEEIKVSWDVTIPQNGYSKIEFSFTGNGYRFFDMKNSWEFGMFLKGKYNLSLDAVSRDANKNYSIKNIEFSGNTDMATKVKN